MDSNRIEVQKFLEKYFEIGRFVIKEYPLLPGGVIIQDTVGNILCIYWDINKQKVVVK